MCGISGYITSHKLDESHLSVLAESLTHRGPDNMAYFKEDRVRLAHNRLSIIDLDSRSNQPFHSHNGRYVMVYNGEIYNFRELAGELNRSMKTKSDTEVVLEAYVKWGKEFVHKLNGMFAIAIYDREEKSLSLWRDRIGIKPLYYYWDGSDFAFASELKALLKLPLNKEWNAQALNDYLFLEYIPQPQTMYRHFYKVESGQCIEFKNAEVRTERYYNLLHQVKEGGELPEAHYLEEFTRLFESSLRYRSISDVPIGAFLSGGLDSTSVCLGLTDIQTDLSSFNIGFSERAYDESVHAREISEILKSKHTSYQLRDSDLLESMKFLMGHYDEPFAVSSIFPTYKVCQLAKNEITVALSGDGGDELFMGYGHYNWLDRLTGLDSFAGRSLRHITSFTFKHLPGRFERIGHLLDYESIQKDWPHIWSQEQNMFTEKEISRLMGREYKNTSVRESWNEICQVSSDLFQCVSLFDLKHYLPDDLLYKVDMASMANSLEVRLPFLDHRLVEFAINVPTKYKFRKNRQKHLLRNYLAHRIPPAHLNRKKWGFGAPVDLWLKGPLKPLMHELLAPSNIQKSGHFDPEFVRKIMQGFEKGKTQDFKKVWALMTFQLWQENFG